MSQAFVREAEAEDEEAAELAPLPPGTRNYITPAGHARMQAELAELVRRERPQVVAVVAWAASNGDRSENGDYLYGKKRLRELDRRIRWLTRRLEQAVVVDPTRQERRDTVFFGATVECQDADGNRARYSIVGLDEAAPARGRISWRSPLAQVLLKARLGDRVRLYAPGGMRELEIVAIEYTELD